MIKPHTWQDVLAREEEKAYFKQIIRFVKNERAAGHIIFPADSDVFNAFLSTEFSDIKVVILGQDPYHGPNQSHGLCFSVQPDVKIPPSLKNIYKELANNIDGFEIPNHGFLQSWAEQGVLLLNTVLTVEQGKAHSHAKIGWETYTDHVIDMINQHREGVVFLLWGAHAQRKGTIIDRDKHKVLVAPHPSPLSAHRGFLGCAHFSQVNQYLSDLGVTPIDWQPSISR